jgi:XTP/dITP diphosphohydrolase
MNFPDSMGGGMTLLLATKNSDKVKEIRDIIGDLPITVRDLSSWPEYPDVEETGATIEENALLKARSASAFTGLAAMADDTGLFVEALGGEPGVRSSRYAGEGASYADNCRLLLSQMRNVPPGRRGAKFVCAVALVFPTGREEVFLGEVAGVITDAPRGESGFGYDPVFFHPPSGRTFAEMSLEEKNALSHRFLAVKKAIAFLRHSRESGNPGF